jgi:hypothetical protein
MRVQPGLHGNGTAVLMNIHTYIYGVTTGRKKNRAAASPGFQKANFFHLYGPVHNKRVAYIYGVYTRSACKVRRPKAAGPDGPMNRAAFSYLCRRPHFEKLQIFARSRRLPGHWAIFHLSVMAEAVPGGPAKRIYGFLRVQVAATRAFIPRFWLDISGN